MDHAHPCVACHRVGAHTIGCPMIPAPRSAARHDDPCAACGGTATHTAGCPMVSAPVPAPRVYSTPVMLAVTPPGADAPMTTREATPISVEDRIRSAMHSRFPGSSVAVEVFDVRGERAFMSDVTVKLDGRRVFFANALGSSKHEALRILATGVL